MILMRLIPIMQPLIIMHQKGTGLLKLMMIRLPLDWAVVEEAKAKIKINGSDGAIANVF